MIPTRLIPFQFNDVQTYILILGDQAMQIIKDGAYIVDPATGGPLTVITPWAVADLFQLKFIQSADVITVCHPDYMPWQIERFSDVDWRIIPFYFVNGPFQELNTNEADLFDFSASTGDITIHSENVGIFTPDMVGLPLYVKQNPYYCVNAWVPNQLYHAGNNIIWGQNYYIATDLNMVTSDDDPEPHATSGTVPPTVTEGFCNDGNPGVHWQYLHSGFGICIITGYIGPQDVTATVAGDANRLPTTNDPTTPDPTYLVALPAWEPPPPGLGTDISPSQGFPSAVAYFQDRQVFANTPARPMTMWFSRTGGFLDFGQDNPVLDDNAVTFSLQPNQMGQVPAIKHFLELGYLLILTSAGIWMVEGGTATSTSIVTPSSINLSYQGANLVSDIPPIRVNNYGLFIQDKGQQVRTIGYSFAENAFIGRDITVMSHHLLQYNKIISWAYQEIPHSAIWMVRDDGQLLSLTFNPEQQIEAWARHDTNGKYLDVCVIPEIRLGQKMDSVYVIVQRVLNGALTNVVERFYPRYCEDYRDFHFVDCGLIYDGRPTNTPASTFSGLDHLIGLSVKIVADGIVYPDQIVPGTGTISIDNPALVVHIGLGYVSDFETLEISSMKSDIRDKMKLINAVSLILHRSAGFEVGPDDQSLLPYKTRDEENYGRADYLIGHKSRLIDMNITCDWNKKGRVWVQQAKPLPLTILAAIPQVQVGGY